VTASKKKPAVSLNSINNFVFAMEIRSDFHASVTDNSNVQQHARKCNTAHAYGSSVKNEIKDRFDLRIRKDQLQKPWSSAWILY